MHLIHFFVGNCNFSTDLQTKCKTCTILCVDETDGSNSEQFIGSNSCHTPSTIDYTLLYTHVVCEGNDYINFDVMGVDPCY